MPEPELVLTPRHRGMVNWFGLREGYGFVRHRLSDETEVDLFFHATEFKFGVTLSHNQMIEYSVCLTDKGPRAVDCVVLKSVPVDEVARAEEAIRQRLHSPRPGRKPSNAVR